MIAILSRSYSFEQTRGVFGIYDGDRMVLSVKTLELPNLDNAKNVSCIPEGLYNVIKEWHEKRGWIFRVLNVKNRTDILIHIGNYAAGKKVDTEGCILPGMKFVDINNDGNLDVANSSIAMSLLIETLPGAFRLFITS